MPDVMLVTGGENAGQEMTLLVPERPTPMRVRTAALSAGGGGVATYPRPLGDLVSVYDERLLCAGVVPDAGFTPSRMVCECLSITGPGSTQAAMALYTSNFDFLCATSMFNLVAGLNDHPIVSPVALSAGSIYYLGLWVRLLGRTANVTGRAVLTTVPAPFLATNKDGIDNYGDVIVNQGSSFPFPSCYWVLAY